MKKLLSVIDAISIWSGKAAGWLILLVVGFIIYEILMRYVFHLPTLWVSESMVFGAGLTYVLGAAWALQDNRHVKIDLIYGRLTPRQRAVIDSITFVFFALYLGVFSWATAEFARRSAARNLHALRIPLEQQQRPSLDDQESRLERVQGSKVRFVSGRENRQMANI